MAGRARKAREHKNKMAFKRAAKAQKRALYASLAGSSKKSKKRHKKRVGIARFNTFTPGKHRHLMAYCGNPGCGKCGV